MRRSAGRRVAGKRASARRRRAQGALTESQVDGVVESVLADKGEKALDEWDTSLYDQTPPEDFGDHWHMKGVSGVYVLWGAGDIDSLPGDARKEAEASMDEVWDGISEEMKRQYADELEEALGEVPDFVDYRLAEEAGLMREFEYEEEGWHEEDGVDFVIRVYPEQADDGSWAVTVNAAIEGETSGGYVTWWEEEREAEGIESEKQLEATLATLVDNIGW